MMLVLLLIFLTMTPAMASEEGGLWWYKQAEELYHQGDAQKALAVLEEIPKRFPKDQKVIIKARLLAAQIFYEAKKYQKAIEALKPLNIEDLTPQALLILAESYEAKGLYDEALTYVNLIQKRFLEDQALCRANLVAARIFLARKLYAKTLQLGQKILKSSCGLKERAEAICLLIKAGEPLEKVYSFAQENPEARWYAPEIIRALALYHLKKDELPQAEKEIFEYLNYSGQEKEIPDLLFRLAEAYFKKVRYREARRLYELILTSWPYSKEASFAKFRLYYMRYLFEEKIGHKLPITRRLLLAICQRLKKKFPQAPITEEAHALEIKLLFENRQPEEALASIWDFLRHYPHSPYLSDVYQVLCRASSLVDQKFLGEKAYFELISFHLSHQKAFKEAGCGLHFYWLAQAYKALNLQGEALLSLIEAKTLSVPPVWQPNLLLDLIDLLLERGKKEDLILAQSLFQELTRKYPDATQTPYSRFLFGRFLYETGQWAKALAPLKESLEKTADEGLKKRAKELYLEALVRVGEIEEAFDLLEKEKKPNLLLTKRIALLAIKEERLSFALKVTNFLVKKAPDDDEAWWLQGLTYEKLGEANKAQKIWERLAGKKSLYATLATSLVKASSLIDQARSEIY